MHFAASKELFSLISGSLEILPMHDIAADVSLIMDTLTSEKIPWSMCFYVSYALLPSKESFRLIFGNSEVQLTR